MQKRQQYANIIEQDGDSVVELQVGPSTAEKPTAALSQDIAQSDPDNASAPSSGRSRNASRQRFLESRRAAAHQNYGSVSLAHATLS
ncbi:unnamed protein product [Phytomonas sp. EM1]|nr:unnamed protein product [Phytomonas sp. EM1]|eukprot:CCW62419.1 unnamed protein product [Phytomonas sp. isolate EM1]